MNQTHPADVTDIYRQAAILVGKAEALGVTLRISGESLKPLAMGHTRHVIDAWPARRGAPDLQSPTIRGNVGDAMLDCVKTGSGWYRSSEAGLADLARTQQLIDDVLGPRPLIGQPAARPEQPPTPPHVRSLIEGLGELSTEVAPGSSSEATLVHTIQLLEQIYSGELPTITNDDRQFLHDNPNTDDVVSWIDSRVSDAVAAERALAKGQPIWMGIDLSAEALAELKQKPTAPPFDVCDGIEQEAFELHLVTERLSPEKHPLHYLFLDPKTNAARQAWKAAILHCHERHTAAIAATQKVPT